MSDKTKTENKNQNLIQAVKFVLFSCSAGIIQAGSFALMNEVIIKMDFFQNLMANNSTFEKIMTNEYGPMYIIALILSVIWNFTFNRKFTFKSANNIPVAMLKVLGYYAVFTPISAVIGSYFTGRYDTELVKYLVLAITMLCNLVTEFLFDKFVVFKEKKAEAKE